MCGTYQHIQRWILFLEGLCKLPDFPCFRHVHDMDVYLLEQTDELSFFFYKVSPVPDNTHRISRLIDNVRPGLFCFVFVPTHHVDCSTWKQNMRLYFELM